jgi:hypothetical protein
LSVRRTWQTSCANTAASCRGPSVRNTDCGTITAGRTIPHTPSLLLRRNRDIQEKLRDFSADLHTYLIGGARIDQQTPILRLGAAAAR